MKNISIALDGPAGAGKSTIAKEIAKLKNYLYIDTGAMYRAIALKILNAGIDIENINEVQQILSNTQIDMDQINIYLDGENVTAAIRDPEISRYVSSVAKIPAIRYKMTEIQRNIALNRNIVMDGRDIGTTVLPNASYKFFITASLDERARRRYEELISKGFFIKLEDVKVEIQMRDKIDSERELAPLKKAEDAILIDTTGLTIKEVIDKITNYIDKTL